MHAMMCAVNPGIEKLFECYREERLSPEQVGEALGQSPGTIRRQLRNGELPGYRLGVGSKAPWVCVRSEVIAALRARWNQEPPTTTDIETVEASAGRKE